MRQFDILVGRSIGCLATKSRPTQTVDFANVRLFTLAEGEISELHVGLKGTMNALLVEDLADKTRRGLSGRASERAAQPAESVTVTR